MTDFWTTTIGAQPGGIKVVPGNKDGVPFLLLNLSSTTVIYLSDTPGIDVANQVQVASLPPLAAIVFDNEQAVYASVFPGNTAQLSVTPGATYYHAPATTDVWHSFIVLNFTAPFTGSFNYIALSGSQTQLVMVSFDVKFASATINNGATILGAGQLPPAYVPPAQRIIPATIQGIGVTGTDAYAPIGINTDGSVTYLGQSVTAGVTFVDIIGQGIYELAV